MPLRARINGEDIFAFDHDSDSWNELKASYKNTALLMPCCDSRAIPKISKLNNYFFAHNRKEECSVALESAEHIFLKTLIAKKSILLGWNVVTEKPGVTPDGEHWIADIFCTKGNAKVVFEVQWSPQTTDEFKRIQEKYTSSGVRAAWLYKLRGNKEYYQSDIPHARETPVFGIKYRKNSKDLYVPQFDTSVDDFVSGMLQGKLRWFPTKKDNITAKIIPIFETCWKCNKTTKSIVGVYFYNNAGEEISCVCFTNDGIPELIMKHTNNKTLASHGVGAIKNRYSKTVGGSYLSNGCCHCDAIQRDFFISNSFSHYPWDCDLLDPILEFIVNDDEMAPYITGGWRFEEKQKHMKDLLLIAVIEVPDDKKVICQSEGCGRSVYKSVHIVRMNGEIQILGSECFKKYAGEHRSQKQLKPMYGSSDGIPLSEYELSLLRENTEQLISEFESKYATISIEENKVSDTSDYSDLSDTELKAFSLVTIKDNFRKNKGLNPELPGWSGWVKSDAESLYKHLKEKQNQPGRVLLDETAQYIHSKNNFDAPYSG